jgi:hypothetical protein
VGNSIDHLVGAAEQRGGYSEGREIDNQLKLGRLLHRQVARFLTLEDAANVECRSSMRIKCVGSVAPACLGPDIRSVPKLREDAPQSLGGSPFVQLLQVQENS